MRTACRGDVFLREFTCSTATRFEWPRTLPRLPTLFMSPDRPAAASKSRFAMAGALAAACVLLGGVLLGVRHLTRDEPISARQVIGTSGPAALRLPAPPAISQDYVGSMTCRECHHEIWDRYQTHPMAQSLGRVQDVAVVENYSQSPPFHRGGREYYVERRGSAVLHHERQLDEVGETIYDQGVEVQYAIGSGQRGRTYIIDRGGLLFQSPISWYSENRRWDLAPGYPDHGHQRFERRIVDKCISCHAGRVAPDAAWVDHFQEPVILESAIGCERCHGPGGRHVAARRAPASPGQRDTIVNPAKLSPDRRDSVCNQCHLHGDSEILRYGRRDFDFRPGMHVGEVWSFLLSHQDHDGETTRAVSQVEQMYESACARRSNGRFACISCHDPHFSPSESEKPAFYRARCLKCHAVDDCAELSERRQAETIADSCVICHMPRLSASDVPHTSQTDHRVPRRPGGVPAKLNGTTNVAPSVDGFPEIFDLAAAPLSALEESRVRGLITAQKAEETRNHQMANRAIRYLEPVFRAAPDDHEMADYLAVCRFLERDEDSAIALWGESLQGIPVREQTLQSLVLAFRKQGKDAEALRYLDRLIKVNPWLAHFWEQRSQILSSLGRRDESLKAGLRALELDPSLRGLYRPLAGLARSLGDTVQAERLERTAQRFRPVE